MDITEAFRNEDISKTDFFDFVVAPDLNSTQSLQQFTKQMRSVNVFLENENSENKETNNNLIDTSIPATIDNNVPTSTYDPTFWNCDKETARLETAILEDLNKYCWSQDSDISAGINGATGNKIINNTDGHIYTLTVLNGAEQTNWYRPPLTAIVKDDDGSMSSPSPMDHMQQPALDIDSILNIIPHQLNGYNNGYEHTLSPHDHLNTDGLIKSETYTYDDSGYADTKDDIANQLIIDTPLLEAHDSFSSNNNNNNNNNNDWKIDNNNTTNNAESLLRSALQGKAFVRYNGQKPTKMESHTELKRALSVPPVKTETSIETDNAPLSIPLNTNIVLFDDGGSERVTHDSDNPSSTHSMDDILLSQLDSASYPEDYEKLKRIANEVAESVQQYCQLEPVDTNIYAVTPDITSGGIVQPIMTPPTVTSTKSTPKKYKRSNSTPNKQTNSTSSIQNATSTSNGIRKERSLHYCSICSKGFKDKYSVNVHIRTHTGEKPFACTLCGKSFRQKAHLAKHYQTHMAQKNTAAAGVSSPNKKSPTTTPVAVVAPVATTVATGPVTVTVSR